MDGRRPGTSERIYRTLVCLYPSAFRVRFADEMVQLFSDQLRDARARETPLAVGATWFRMLGELTVTVVSEHLEGGRDMARTLAAPSITTRALGLAGMLGGLAVLAAFVLSELIFETLPWLITVRIELFLLGAIAIVVGIHRRPAWASSSRFESVVVWATIVANAWYAGMVLLPVVGWAPFAGDNHLVGFLAGLAMWITDASFGLVVARRGGFLRAAGLTLALGSVLTLLGIDRLGLTHGDFSAVFIPLTLAGQGLNGIGWVLLGWDLATRRQPARTAS